jgi:hypothetical protein
MHSVSRTERTKRQSHSEQAINHKAVARNDQNAGHGAIFIQFKTQEEQKMKKIVMLLIAAVMLFGVSGQAMASFSQGDLIQVVYQMGGSMEVATDLGAFAPTTAYTGSNLTFNTNPFPVAGTGVFASATDANLQIAYYVIGSGATTIWTSGPQAGQVSGSRQQAAIGNMNIVNTKYASLNTGSQATLAQGDPQSYFSIGDKSINANGVFAGFIPAANGEMNLGALATAGYVDSYLYYYPTPSLKAAGVQVATIRTFANGTSEVVGPVTPIPASVLLLGSGLMGLVGMRRKQLV